MSLRVVHIFFIIASSALALIMGVWVLSQKQPFIWAAASFACSVCLDFYLVWFIRKSRNAHP